MQVSKRDRSFLRPDKRAIGSVKLSKAFAHAMRDAVNNTLDKGDAKQYCYDNANNNNTKRSK